MRQGKPLRQLSRRFIGGVPVEGHHGRWDTWRTQQLCTPAVGDGHHLYEVRAPADGFFKAMNGHDAIFWRRGDGGRSYASAAADQAKGDAKTASTALGTRSIEASSGKKTCGSSFSTAFARGINNFSTTRVLGSVFRAERNTMRDAQGKL